MYGQCLLNHQNHIYIRVQWKRSNCKLQFPQLDYWPRHSPNFRTVFGIMIGPFSSCKIGKTWGTNKQVNKQTNKEIAIANSTASFFLPVSNIDLKLLLVPPAQQRLNISYWGAKKPLNNGTVLLCSSWTFISEHVMSALCSVIVLQHFFLPDFPSRGAERSLLKATQWSAEDSLEKRALKATKLCRYRRMAFKGTKLWLWE